MADSHIALVADHPLYRKALAGILCAGNGVSAFDIAEATVKAHGSRIPEKLNASSRMQVVVMQQQLDR